jgi:hypothetical protein
VSRTYTLTTSAAAIIETSAHMAPSTSASGFGCPAASIKRKMPSRLRSARSCTWTERLRFEAVFSITSDGASVSVSMGFLTR